MLSKSGLLLQCMHIFASLVIVIGFGFAAAASATCAVAALLHCCSVWHIKAFHCKYFMNKHSRALCYIYLLSWLSVLLVCTCIYCFSPALFTIIIIIFCFFFFGFSSMKTVISCFTPMVFGHINFAKRLFRTLTYTFSANVQSLSWKKRKPKKPTLHWS